MRAQCVLVATTLLHSVAKFHSFLYTGSKTVRVNMESCYGGMSTRLKQRAVTEFLSAENVTPAEIHRRLQAVYLDGGNQLTTAVRPIIFLYITRPQAGYNSVFNLKIMTCQQLQTWRPGELLRLYLTNSISLCEHSLIIQTKFTMVIHYVHL